MKRPASSVPPHTCGRLFAALPALALGLPLALPAQKAPDLRIDTAPRTGLYGALTPWPAIAASGASVYVVWADGRHDFSASADPRDIFFNGSNDAGNSWRAANVRLNTDVPGSAARANPVLAADGAAVYVAWGDDRHGARSIYFNRSLDGGATWLAKDVRLDAAAGSSGSSGVQLAAAGNTVFVTWSDRRNGQPDVFFNRSTDGGTTWLAQDVRLDTDAPGASGSGAPSLAVSGASVYVIWRDQRSGGDDVYFNASHDGGLQWRASDARISALPAGANVQTGPRIAAVGQSVYAVWTDYRSGLSDVYLNRSLDGGVTWLATESRLDTDPLGSAGSIEPQIAASGASVYVTWEDWRRGVTSADVRFNRSLDAGSTWLAQDVRLDAGVRWSKFPKIAASGSSVAVTWYGSGNNGRDIYCNDSSDAGSSWRSAPLKVDRAPTGTSSFYPDIAASGDGVFITWLDFRNQYDQVFFNIPYGFQSYGAGLAGSGGIAPQLDANGAAKRGSRPSLDVSQGVGGAPGALLVGNKAQSPILGGTVLVSPVLSVPIVLGGTPGVPGTGNTSIVLPIPAASSALGVNANFQALFLDAGAPAAVSMTGGIELWIG